MRDVFSALVPLLSVVLLVTAAITPSSALAEDGAVDVPPAEPWQGGGYEPPPSKDWGQGFYVRLGGATGFDMAVADVFNEVAGSNVFDSKPAIGLDARVGARSRHVGSEIQVEWLPGFTLEGPGGDADYGMLSIHGNLHIVILTGRVQPYLLLGGGGTWADFEEIFGPGFTFSGWSLRGGGGIDFFLNRHLAIATDVTYVWPGGDAVDTDYLAFDWGLKYVF